MSSQSEKLLIESHRVRLATRLRYAVVPIEYSSFVAVLKENGFSLSVPTIRTPMATGVTAEPVGPIAQKGNTRLDMDLARGIIGLEGVRSVEILQDLILVEQILRGKYQVNIEERTWFLELLSETVVRAARSAADTLDAILSQSELFDGFESIFGERSSLFGLRLGSKNSEPSSENWFDLRVEPLIHDPRRYFIGLTYRNLDRSKVLGLTKGLEETIAKVINTLEKSGQRRFSKSQIAT